MPDVFMSHSSADAEIAGQVVSALEGDGLSCWIAPRDIGPGTWGDAIIRGIEACRAMVLLFSSSSNNSAHVLREVERAVNKELTIIPFRIDDAGANRDMEYFLSATQWLDARRPPLAERIAELVRQARLVLHAGEGVADLDTTSHASYSAEVPASNKPLKKVRRLIVDGSTGAVLACDDEGGYLYWDDPSGKPAAGSFGVGGAPFSLLEGRCLVSTIGQTNGMLYTGTLALHRLGSASEALWSRAYMRQMGPNDAPTTIWDGLVFMPTGLPSRQIPGIQNLAPAFKILRMSDGEEQSFVKLRLGSPGLRGVWEKGSGIVFDEGSCLGIRDIKGAAMHTVKLPERGDADGRLLLFDHGALVAYETKERSLVVRQVSDGSIFLHAAPTQSHVDNVLLRTDGSCAVLTTKYGWVEGFELDRQLLAGQSLVSTSLSSSFHMDDKSNLAGGRGFIWDPERGLLLLYFTAAEGGYEVTKGTFALRLWRMPDGELVGMRQWSGNRPLSAVFGPKSTCYVGTEAGELFSLRLPDLCVERQLA